MAASEGRWPWPAPLRWRVSWRRWVAHAGVIAAAQLIAMLPIRHTWLGVWTQTGSVFGQSLILTLPVAVTAATWHFGQVRQSSLGDLELTSSRRQWAREGRLVGGLALVSAAGLLGAAGGVGLATGGRATFGGPDLLALLAVLGWTAVAAAIGLRVGGVGRFVVMAPVAGIVTYAALAWLVVRDQGTFALVAPMDWRWMALYSKAGWVSILQAYLAVSVAALLLGLRPHARAIRWSAGAAALVIAVILVTWGDSASRQPDLAAARLVCAPAAHERTVCLPTVKAYQREELVRALALVDAGAPGLVAGDLVFVDDEARGMGRVTDRQLDAALARFHARPTLLASATVDLSAVTQLRQAELVAQTVDVLVAPQADKNGLPLRTDVTGSRQPATPSLVVRRWLYRLLRLPTDGSAYAGAPQIDATTVDFDPRKVEVEWLDGLSADERRQWLTRHRPELAAGTLPWTAFTDE